ncbi:MAG: RecX family transcriptional regulator [Prevotella sp.]|nr:RecX family transcriptional regulator [Prevotella sp.]
MKQISEEDALLRLTSLCSTAEHCSHEMIEKMQRWQLTDDAQARIIEYLVKEKYIDDERYARFFAKDKIRYNKWGRRKVEQAMWLKHIDGDIQRDVLDDIDDEEYLAVLRPLLKTKRKSVKASSDYEMNMKLIRFAMGRGFTMDIIRQCLDNDNYDDIDNED